MRKKSINRAEVSNLVISFGGLRSHHSNTSLFRCIQTSYISHTKSHWCTFSSAKRIIMSRPTNDYPANALIYMLCSLHVKFKGKKTLTCSWNRRPYRFNICIHQPNLIFFFLFRDIERFALAIYPEESWVHLSTFLTPRRVRVCFLKLFECIHNHN